MDFKCNPFSLENLKIQDIYGNELFSLAKEQETDFSYQTTEDQSDRNYSISDKSFQFDDTSEHDILEEMKRKYKWLESGRSTLETGSNLDIECEHRSSNHSNENLLQKISTPNDSDPYFSGNNTAGIFKTNSCDRQLNNYLNCTFEPLKTISVNHLRCSEEFSQLDPADAKVESWLTDKNGAVPDFDCNFDSFDNISPRWLRNQQSECSEFPEYSKTTTTTTSHNAAKSSRYIRKISSKQQAPTLVAPPNSRRTSASSRQRDYTRVFCYNPFKSLRANVLRLYGYRWRVTPLIKLQDIFDTPFNGSCSTSQELINLRQAAATIIHDFWMRCVFRKVYRHLRNLLFRYRDVDPATVLKPINPREASLVDVASGMYIRFRLGGETFPPIIVYKIYTNRPIVDLGAYSGLPEPLEKRRSASPCAKSRKKTSTSHHFALAYGLSYSKDTFRPYQRVENNDWRPYVSGHLGNCLQQPAQVEVKEKHFVKHHPNRLEREESKRHWKEKQTKDWLDKMQFLYQELSEVNKIKKSVTVIGGYTPSKNLAEENFISQETADGELTKKTVRFELEGDGDSLDWIKSLGFEAYHTDWSCMGTTKSSDHLLINGTSSDVVKDWEIVQLHLD